MSRRKLFGSDATPKLGAFLGAIPNVPDIVVDVQSPSRRKLGRMAESLDKLKEEASESGFSAGFQEGLLEGFQQAQAEIADEKRKLIQQFATHLSEKATHVEIAMKEWYANSEQNLAELAITIAKHILAQEVQLPHDTISNIVRDALQEVTQSTQVRIRINPFDAPDLLEKKQELLAEFGHLRQIEIVEDPSLLGGCVIESDGGRVDASLSSKLEIVEGAIREVA